MFKELETSEPHPQVRPYLWHGDQAVAYLKAVSESVIPGSDVERRVLALRNPKSPGPGVTPTLAVSFQLVKPGEVAPAHRHTASAVRLMVEGSAHTVINGVSVQFEKNDFVITPGWAWHDHGNDTEAPAAWLDGLDAPFTRSTMTWFFERYPSASQEIFRREILSGAKGRMESPAESFPLLYRWRDVLPRLMSLKGGGVSNPFDGAVFNYGESHSNKSVTPTLDCGLALLQPSEHTKAHRHTGCVVSYVLHGNGQSIVNGERFTWNKRDVLLIPPWSWHEHENMGKEDAIFFNLSDSAMVRILGLYREEALLTNDGHQVIVGNFNE
jgi:gentisate 1,2-dioxygenase